MTSQKTVLMNGFTIITHENPNNYSTMLSYWVKAGGNHEKGFPYGIAHFTEHMLFKGTSVRTKDDINEQIDEIGGDFNAATWSDKTRYYTVVPYDQWKVGIDVLSDMMFYSTFPANEIETEKGVVCEEIKRSSDSPTDHGYRLLMDKMKERQPERQSVLGTMDSVKRITRDDLFRFTSTFYVPSNMVLVATGNIRHEELVAYVSQLIPASDQRVNAELPEIEETVLSGETMHVQREIAQAHLRWGVYAPTIRDDDRVVMNVIGTLLGGSMSSRLFKKIREERGLAYTASAGYTGNAQEGFLVGYVGTDVNHVEEVQSIILDELERLKQEPVGDKELHKVHQSIVGTLFRSLDKHEVINHYLAIENMYGVTFDPEKEARKVRQVRAEDIIRVANQYFGRDRILFVELSNRS